MSVENLSTEQLEALIAERRAAEAKERQSRRMAYLEMRADLVKRISGKVEEAEKVVKELHEFINNEVEAFRGIMTEYGDLKEEQQNFKLEEGAFRVHVKAHKVKGFDERADMAVTRLMEFLDTWIKKNKNGADDPMYSLALNLLERNKRGELDYKSISKLYELEVKFNSDEYSAIMELFRESHTVEGNSINYYFEARNERGVWVKREVNFNRL
ncbi:MAG: DUF3164 family protein [Marinifilaceae bacterium]